MKNIISIIVLALVGAMVPTAGLSAAPAPSPEATQDDILNRNNVAFPRWRLEKDWIYQDHDVKDAGRCFADAGTNAVEVKIVRKVLDELKKRNVSVENDEKTLAGLVETKTAGNDPRWKELYFRLCEERRRARLSVFQSHPRRYVYTKHHVFADCQPSVTATVHQTDGDYRDRGPDYTMGSELCVLTVNDDGSVSNEVLYRCPGGVLRDPSLSFDGRKIAFSMRMNDVDDNFHLYVMELTDGNVRQITFGPGTVDVEPCYLPTNDLVFSSTRCDQTVPCWYNDVTNLYICDDEGRYLRRLSYDQAHAIHPQIMSDGRITYTRWEYLDRMNSGIQPAFVMNPDGTNQTEFYGNNSLVPVSLIHVRGIPNSQKAVGIMTGHHVAQHGKLVLIDRTKGTQENKGMKYICPEKEIVLPDAGIYQFTSGGKEFKATYNAPDYFGYYGDQYQYPYALDERNFLVSYIPEDTIRLSLYPQRGPYPNKFGIYWMGIDGERELLIYDPTISSGQHCVFGPRPAPPMRPSQVDEEQTHGTFYVQDVYVGPGLKGIPRGTVKKLRVIGVESRAAGTHKIATYPTGDGTRPGVAINNGSSDVKHVLGTVDVEDDGSACFRVPARTSVYFQLLDEKGHTVQTMRSWTVLMPGETLSCIGCHEDKNSNTIGNLTATKALRKEPQKLEPFFKNGDEPLQEQLQFFTESERRAWDHLSVNAPQGEDVPRGFSYRREIQPIWDRHCIGCHAGSKNPENSEVPLSLLGDSKEYDEKEALKNVKWLDVHRGDRFGGQVVGRDFSESYLNLTTYGHKNDWLDYLHTYGQPEMIDPYSFGSSKSKLMEYLEPSHYDVKLTCEEKNAVACWIDLCIPYCGSYMEANTWDGCRNGSWYQFQDQLRAVYLYREAKRLKHAEVEIDHLDKYREHVKTGKTHRPEEFAQMEFGGQASKKQFVVDFLARNARAPIFGAGEGLDCRGGTMIVGNPVRNLASNPQAATHQVRSYPHATSNSRHKYRAEFSPKNLIDGNTSQDAPFWKPDPRTDLWIQVDFGREALVEKTVIHLKKFPGREKTWTSATLLFSDGERIPIKLKCTEEAQEFVFPVRKTSFLRLTELKEPFPLGENGIVEWEIFGKDAN